MFREGLDNANVKIKEFKIIFLDKEFCNKSILIE